MNNLSTNPFSSLIQHGLHNYARQNIHGHEHEARSQTAFHDNSVSKAPPQNRVDLKIVGALEKTLNREGLSLKGLDADEFSPKNVADKILSSVRQAFGQFKQTHSDTKDSQFFSEIKEGLDRGFDEAREILQNLGALNGQISDDIDETQELTLQGLVDLESSTLNIQSNFAIQSTLVQSSRSAEIQVKTQEGDIVTLSFSQSKSSSRSALEAQQQQSSLNVYQTNFSEKTQFEISVEGNLNEDEQNSIKHLTQQIHKISNAFFHGNGKAAIQHAQKLGFDTEQIASVALDLNTRKSIQTLAAYKQTNLPENSVNSDLLSQATDFLNQANELLKDTRSTLQPLAEPNRVFNDLFMEIGGIVHGIQPKPDPGDDSLFAELVNNIGQSVFAVDEEKAAA